MTRGGGFERAIEDKEWRAKAEKWLKKNPPPAKWEGTRLEWAYTEMLDLPLWLRKFLGL